MQMLKESLGYCLPTIPHVIAGWIISVSDRIFLERYFSLAEVGIYSLGFKIGSLILIFHSAFRKAYIPFFYKTALSKMEKTSKNKLFKFSNQYILFVLVGSFIITLISKETITFLFNSSYVEAYRIVPIIALSYFISSATGIINISITFKKKTMQIMYMFAFAAAVKTILNFLLIPIFGIYGAAYATLFSFCIYFILNYWYAHRCYFIPLNWKLIIKYFIPLVAIITAFTLFELSLIITLILKSIIIISFLTFTLNKNSIQLKELLIRERRKKADFR